MEESDEGVRKQTLCRVERAVPGTDWENSWRLARLPGLGPENLSFLFKMMHDILPTQERVARTKPRASSSCTMLGCTVVVCEDLPHALILCDANNGVGYRVLRCMQNYLPDAESALRLELNVEEDLQLPLVWLLASVFLAIWKLRLDKARVQLYEVRAQLEAKVNLLRETRFRHSAEILDQLVENYF